MTAVFIPKETHAGETRVSATPETVQKMVKEGLEVTVEAGAGATSWFTDQMYEKAGATIASGADADRAWGSADLVTVVRAPSAERVTSMKADSLLIGLLAPYRNHDTVRALAEKKISSLAMELVPRISRAQSMDALSSQASIAGYKSVIVAAAELGRYFPLLMTAAGTIPPARVVIMGAGVAGLQAIATAKRLGATVEVSDIRPEVEEQVHSLGGKFIPLPEMESGAGEGGYAKEMGEEFLRKQREIVAQHVSQANVVITTALIPGKPAPRLVTEEMVEGMRNGAVIVDLAVEQGGNCALSKADETVVHGGVTILGPSNLAATLPEDASTMYARNIHALLQLLETEDEGLKLDMEDEVIAGSLLTHGGEVVHEATAKALQEVSA